MEGRDIIDPSNALSVLTVITHESTPWQRSFAGCTACINWERHFTITHELDRNQYTLLPETKMSLQIQLMFEESSNVALQILQSGCTVVFVCLPTASHTDYKSCRTLQNVFIDST